MKIKVWLILLSVLCGLLVALSSATGVGVAERGEASNPESVTTASGMPGRPVPARPIPHHEPGQLSKAANISRNVTQVNAAGVEETVELGGLEAMLADGTISDPFGGNYTFVNLDQILVARNDDTNIEADTWTAFEPPDQITTPAVISGSLATLGTGMADTAPSIAAGDLNGDGKSEQIVAWIGDSGTISLTIGELPGMLGRLTSDPAAVAHEDGQMDLLVRGYDNALWHHHYTGTNWLEWNNDAGGYLLSGPALASGGDGQFDVFAAGVYSGTGVVYTDTATSIYRRHWDGTAWSADWDLVDVDPADGLPLEGDPAAVARGTDGIDLFRRASDNTLRWLHYDGAAWGEWQNLGGIITSAPAAVSWGPNHLQVFARGFDGMLWHCAYDGSSWGTWGRLGGLVLASAPTAVSPAANQIDIYARGEDDALWWNRFGDGSIWFGWQSLGGLLGSGVGVAVHDGSIDLFAQTADDPDTEESEPDGSLQQKSYDGAAWTDWADRGGLKACCWAYDTGVEGDLVTVETGYFTGDGREQIVLAYGITQTVGVNLYDVSDGFRPELLASHRWQSDRIWLHLDVATGDLDVLDSKESRDEIAFAAIDNPWTSDMKYRCWVVVLDVIHDAGQGDWQIDRKRTHWAWSIDSSFTDVKSAITSGDFNGDGDDELASAWVACGEHYCYRVLDVYDYGDNWNIHRTDRERYGDYYDVYADVYVDLAVADLDLDGTDAIVYTGPANAAVLGELAVYSANPLTDIQQPISITFELENLPSKVAVGDFNRDLKPEIAHLLHITTTGEPMDLRIYGYDEGHEFSLLAHRELSQTLWSSAGLFSIAAGDLTGESLRVGPPTYRLDRGVATIVAILNGPPFHRDTLDGEEHTIAVGNAAAAYESESTETNNFESTFMHNWGLDVGVGTGVGDAEGTHVAGSIDTSFGEHFEKTEGTLTSLIKTETVETADSDLLITVATSYKVWEYPVYADDDDIPDSHMAVVFPVGDEQEWHIEDGLQCNTWYKPTHQVGNIWSYPAIGNEEQFSGYDPDDLESHLAVGSHTAGGSVYEWSLETSTLTTTQRSGGASFGVVAGLETQVGGDEVECKPFGIGTSARLPYAKFSVSAHHDFEHLGESESELGDSTTVRNGYGPVDPEDIFAVDSHLFWARGDYLVLDHATKPQPQAFWNRYDKPDPTFLRPWVDGHCDTPTEDKTDYSPDIDIRPYYANPGETVAISATVRNYSNKYAYNVTVRFYLGDPDDGGRQIGADQVIPTLARAIGPETVAIEWTAEGRGLQRIYAVVDPDNELEEMHDEVNNVNNNKGYNLIQIGAAGFIDPGLSGEEDYYALAYGGQGQSQGLAFVAYIPLANLDEVVSFEFVSLDSAPVAPTGMAVIGAPVALVAYLEGLAQESFDLKPAPDSPPSVITVQYNEAALGDTAEEDLRFYTWTGTEWAEPTCAGHTLQHLSEHDMFVVPVCETGTFALFGDDYNVFLPLVLRNG
ncbi:MAG: CARDB domain-containing protein [Chloroflexota bacterium]|nr:CARDB domain-containing protein [Chloroflexota bacterium]